MKVGHAGTLDPFASGLMIVLVGRAPAPRSSSSRLDKRYETLAQLGARSTTAIRGRDHVTGRVPASPLALPTGAVRQRPPVYSAIKIDGERAYKRARRGEEVEVPERTVQVHEFTELARNGDQVRLALHCSSGTYVRSLVADLDDGYCLELRRTAIGPFSISEAVPLDQIDSVGSVTQSLIPLDRARSPSCRRSSSMPIRPSGSGMASACPSRNSPVRRTARGTVAAARRPRSGGRGEVGRRARRDGRRLRGMKLTWLPTLSAGPGVSRSAPSTACTSVTAR